MKTRYFVVPAGDDWKLISVTDTKFGGVARNYVCRGTKEHCQSVLDRFQPTSKSVVDPLLKDIQK